VWMFATPVVYPSSLLSEPWQTLYGLNPMVGVIEGFRWALLDTDPPRSMIFLSALVAVALFGSGLYYFRQAEETFADVV
jgi:lipopolysaccharide transport system permease protein